MSIENDRTVASETDDDHADQPRIETIGGPMTAPDQVVEVRRRAGMAVALGAGASLVAIAYCARAVGSASPLDWLIVAVLGAIGVVNLAALLDARTPLLVADDLGVRLRLGRTWVGLPWGGIQAVEHRPRHRWRDGLLAVDPHYVQRVLEDLDGGARRSARLNRRLHGAPLSVPLGLGTRVVGADPDLVSALRDLADGRTPVLDLTPTVEPPPQVPEQTVQVDDAEVDAAEVDAAEVDAAEIEQLDLPSEEPAAEREPGPAKQRIPDPRPALARLIGVLAARFDRAAPDADADDSPSFDPASFDPASFDPASFDPASFDPWSIDPAEPGEPPSDEPEIVASPTPLPVRETVAATRAEFRHESRAEPAAAPFEETTQVWNIHPVDDRSDTARDGDGFAAHDEVLVPIIGPHFARARERLRLTVDELAERTRIRPHVIEAIEVDDFSACGGDFYARGHLRTLARVLGLDVTPLLETYDERYADAPIDPRRVFEAELAGAGSIRATRGGPNWSVLVAAVMALILCWSVARLVTAGPSPTPDRAILSGSGGPDHTRPAVAEPVPLRLTADGGGARVVVRNGTGKVVFSGDLAYGQSHTLQVAPPIRVRSSDGAVRVRVAGHDRGRMGPAGRSATRSYVPSG